MQAKRIPPSDAHPAGPYARLHIGPADGPGVCVFDFRRYGPRRRIWRFAPTVRAAESYLTRLRAGLVKVYVSDGYEPSRRSVSAASGLVV